MLKQWMVAAAGAAMVLAIPAAAQPLPFRDPLVDRLAGKWILRGTVQGREVVHDVTAQWVLGHQYMLLQETSRELKPGTTAPAYQAHIYIGWDQPQRRYGAVWLDVNGEVSTPVLGTAEPTINALPFVFAGRDGAVTRTTLTYDRSAQRWRWQVVTEKDGQSTTSADLVMVRAPSADPATPSGPQDAGTPSLPADRSR